MSIEIYKELPESIKTKRLNLIKSEDSEGKSIYFDLYKKKIDKSPKARNYLGHITLTDSQEIMYIIYHKDDKGEGYISEALNAIINNSPNNLKPKFYLKIKKGNSSSKKAAEKCNFEKIDNISDSTQLKYILRNQ